MIMYYFLTYSHLSQLEGTFSSHFQKISSNLSSPYFKRELFPDAILVGVVRIATCVLPCPGAVLKMVTATSPCNADANQDTQDNFARNQFAGSMDGFKLLRSVINHFMSEPCLQLL